MDGQWKQVGRDPFARTTVMRRTVVSSGDCRNCGQTRRSGKLFQYGVERDAVRPIVAVVSGLFDSIECMRAYHG
jgi:hypothetical protein